VILVVDLVEKSTGELSIGAGYTTGGDSPGPTVEGSVAERNFLGRGQYIRFAAGIGENSRDYTFSFTEPYFLGSRISAGFDIFRTTRRYDDYESESTGATVRFGLPITQNLSTQLAYTFSRDDYSFRDGCDPYDVSDPCDVSVAIVEGVETSPWDTSAVSNTILYNTIDDMKNPHSGYYATFTTQVAGLGGDAEYVKFTGRGSYYHTLSEELDIVGLASVGGGHVLGYGGQSLRIFDHFQNNDRMIRGFEYNGIGPYDANTGDHLGGTTYFNGSLEAQFPLPVLPESLGIRGAVFADAATLYGNKIAPTTGLTIAGSSMEWRASVGAGLIWASPFGPLRVDVALPILEQENDQTQLFNFGISTRF
jgi:outer membrane protein insertion porin family